MSPADQIVFVVYIIGMLGVAVVFARLNTSFSAMFAANGQAPWWVSGLSAFMTMFSAGSFVVWGGLAYREGLVAVTMLAALGVSGLLVAFLVAPRWKSLDIASPSDFIRQRFGRHVNLYFSWMLIAVRIISSGVALYALSVVLAPLILPALEASIAVPVLILIVGAVVVGYTMLGGLWAVLMTDVLQFVILTIAVILTVILSLAAAGGPAMLASELEPSALSAFTDDFSPAVVAAWIVTHVFVLGAEWAFVQRHLSVPSPRDARRAMVLFGVLYLVSPLIWMAPAIAYRVMAPDADPEQAYILISLAVLPIGLVGLMAAAMFSATASMISSQLNVFSGTLVELLAKRTARSGGRQALWLGRAATCMLGLAVMLVALAVPRLGGAEAVVLTLMSLLISPLFAPALWGVFSKTIGPSAVWTVAALAGGLGIVAKIILPPLAGTTGPGLAAWVTGNPRIVDAVIGVMVPLLILSVMELHGRRSGMRGARVGTLKRIAGGDAASYLPLLTVCVALGGCALIIALLIPLNEGHRALLAATVGVLLLLAVSLIPPLVRRRPSRLVHQTSSGRPQA